ncbi:MAG TPA: sigma-70 family RNA polymerase sigma factor [Candidatus Angelobacter sp.]|jgi:RNA polymerase sigma-70 factor (ECF subfamily)|nr:sigma-70 family RNA polymerase sigma factor [Candidatus Angelobacter sp.]
MTTAEAAARTPEPAGDALLLSRAQGGDADAFSELLRPLYESGHRVATSILLNSGEAEDALQEATVRAWRRLGGLREIESIEGWFLSIVVNESRRRLRGRWHRVLPWGLPRHSMEPRDHHDAHDIRSVVQDALMRLDAEHRVVLVLRYYYDLPLQRVAEQLRLPVGTVKSRLSRATDRLRDVLSSTEMMS